MRKIIISLLLITFFLFNRANLINAQIITPPVPGVSCGNAETPGAEACCKKITVSLPAVPGVLAKIPGVKDIIEKLNDFVMTLDRAQNIAPCVIGYPSDPNDPNCVCLKESSITPTPIEAVKELCQKYISGKEKGDCEACANKGGVWTGVRCVYGDFSRFITEILLGWGIGLAGTIALLCIIYSAFQLQTSQGNPEKIKKAQELLTSCIMGLMLIIFSIFILKLIGVNILKIPGFGG